MGRPCSQSLQVCLALVPPGVFDKANQGKVLTREQAYDSLKKTEEEGLVHLTSNVQGGNIYICNCCGCCWTVLDAINKLGMPASKVINSHYYAKIDSEKCPSFGICASERFQVKANEEGEEA